LPILLGDLNVDYLPVDTDDPWREVRGQDNHLCRRQILDHFLERFSLKILKPAEIGDPPPGPFHDQYRRAYYTRVPIGEQNAFPARIDAVAVPADVSECHHCINWKDVPADHAWIGLTLPAARRIYSQPRRPQTWRPKDSDTLTSDVASELPETFTGTDDFEDFCQKLQLIYGDGLTRNQRRKLREPFHIKVARHHLSSSITKTEYRHRQNKLFNLRRNFMAHIRKQLDIKTLRRGGAIYRSKKLHVLSSMEINGAATHNSEHWAAAIKSTYSNKWNTQSMADKETFHDFCHYARTARINISEATLRKAMIFFRDSNRVDSHGVAGRIVMAIAFSDIGRTILCSLINALLTSDEALQSYFLAGSVAAKSVGTILPTKTRAIVPCPWAWLLLHASLYVTVEPYITAAAPRSPAVLIGGGTKGHQPLEIGMTAKLIIEKGMDRHSSAAVAQGDIATFFDRILPGRLVKYLLSIGVPLSHAVAIVKIHVLPQIRLKVGASSITISRRTCGLNTGTLTAALLSRCPVQHMACARSHVWEQWGFPTSDGSSLALSTWADNLVSFSESAVSACAIIDDAAMFLEREWDLTISSDSKELLPARGHIFQATDISSQWTVLKTMKCLGFTISDNGSDTASWRATKQSIWRSWWGNFHRTAKSLREREIVVTAERLLVPALLYQSAAWSWSTTMAEKLDKLQLWLIGKALNLPFRAGETVSFYLRRRTMHASRFVTNDQLWSCKWKRSNDRWQKHLDDDPTLWPSRLIATRPLSFIDGIRDRYGYTRSRLSRSYVHKRWEQGRIDMAGYYSGAHFKLQRAWIGVQNV